VRPIVDTVRELTDRGRPRIGPFLLAIDGRSSSGKSTLARRVARSIPGSAIVHTDDIAWWHSRLGWDDLLVAHVIEPLRRGEGVDYRPPAWEARGRPGSVKVPADAALVLIEGVGSGRASLAERVDAVIWVHSDPAVTEQRNRRRIAAGEIDARGLRRLDVGGAPVPGRRAHLGPRRCDRLGRICPPPVKTTDRAAVSIPVHEKALKPSSFRG
jgi:hypothetical protein